MKDENILDTSKMVVGFLLHSKLNELLDEGGISKREFNVFYKSVREFHRAAFNYAISNFPLQDEFLQRTQFMNFYDQECTFKIVFSVVEKLEACIDFSDQDLCHVKAEFLSL